MAAIDELIEQIDNPTLRERIAAEVHRVVRQKKFGLVFEEHLPERTLLYEVPIQRGSLVARNGNAKDVYQVIGINGGKAECYSKNDKTQVELPLEELTCVAEFGDPIYPYLEPLDSVENAPDSGLWHTLIEADNYHALQLLDYAYHGKVDCIYIDPPYNTGARDWKYNNDYVDGNDQYRHSKWLSMMKKRLLLAKKLLNPKDSVLIVTIDEKEYLHLGCLLEDLFPEAKMQMVSTIIKPEGAQRFNEFSRTNEYIFFLMFGDCQITPQSTTMLDSPEASDSEEGIEWIDLRRREKSSVRAARPNQFYPIFINKKTGFIESIGDALSIEQDRDDVIPPQGCYAFFPISPKGIETMWSKHYETARELLQKGYIKTVNGKNPQKVKVKYLTSGSVEDIDKGRVVITGRGEQNEVIGHYNDAGRLFMPKTVWNVTSHNAQTGGTLVTKKTIGDNRFSFPKSLYAVHDTIRFFVENKPNALVLDFFAGSGTTLHAVNLLNMEDNGNRRCILVTNNEVSEAEAKRLNQKGYRPGDKDWEGLGIARHVTWPRIVCSIKGNDVNGNALKGSYCMQTEKFVKCSEADYSDEYENNSSSKVFYKKIKEELYPKLADRTLADGFPANANFFKLGFLDKDSVSRGKQLEKLIPVLWMKAGAYGKCPSSETNDKYLIYPENRFAVLIDTKYASEFKQELSDDIRVAYIVTDYEPEYRDIANGLHWKTTYQLYRDYLDNFAINTGRE